MYCPKCGSEDQETNTYCRQCGGYLPDFENTRRPQKTPEERFKLSLVFNCLTTIAGISMAIALFVVHVGQENTHPVIYSAISLLIAISVWQAVSFFNNLKLRKRFIRNTAKEEPEGETKAVGSRETNELLTEGDTSNYVAASVTENSTRHLDEKILVSTDAKKQSD